MLNIYEPDQRKGEEHLDGSISRKTISRSPSIHLACDKFKAVGCNASKRFFDCLDTNSTSEHAKLATGSGRSAQLARAGLRTTLARVTWCPRCPIVNAGGIRPGVSNFLTKYMPGELVVHVTGHDLKR